MTVWFELTSQLCLSATKNRNRSMSQSSRTRYQLIWTMSLKEWIHSTTSGRSMSARCFAKRATLQATLLTGKSWIWVLCSLKTVSFPNHTKSLSCPVDTSKLVSKIRGILWLGFETKHAVLAIERNWTLQSTQHHCFVVGNSVVCSHAHAPGVSCAESWLVSSLNCNSILYNHF